MTPTQLAALFRSDVRDEILPFLWKDLEVFDYMDDAQKMFARLTGGIADSSTPEITQFAVTAGDPYVVYDPRILKLRDLRRASDGRDVELLNFEDLGSVAYSDYGRTTSGPVKFTTLAGPIRAAVSGMDANKLRLINPPLADDVLLAIVYRLPLATITAASSEFEIDEQHHRHLMAWMKHLAYSKQDAETYDRGRAAEFEGVFRNYCDQAKREREQREHKYRTVAYGGI